MVIALSAIAAPVNAKDAFHSLVEERFALLVEMLLVPPADRPPVLLQDNLLAHLVDKLLVNHAPLLLADKLLAHLVPLALQLVEQIAAFPFVQLGSRLLPLLQQQ